MATLRELLTHAEFNWDEGLIVWQPVDGKASCPGWAHCDELLEPMFIKNDHWVLDAEFSTGYGSPEMPRFVAKDDKRIYFPVQYDGSTHVDWVCQSLTPYINGTEAFPYPGG